MVLFNISPIGYHNLYFFTINNLNQISMSKNYYQMSESASAQIEIDYLRSEVAKLKEQLKDEKMARELLRKKGFFVDNLWSVDDVTSNYICSQEQAHRVLELALKNEATMEQVWWAIDDAAESLEIKSNQN
jgi:hypothetical protein